MTLSNAPLVEFGKSRYNKILQGLEDFKYLTTPQIAELYFQTIKNPLQRKQKTTTVMKKLSTRGYINHSRFYPESYVYTLKGNKFTTHVDHYLLIANTWIIIRKLVPASSVLTYKVNTKQENVITDLLINYKNEFRRDNKIFYIEVENKSTADITDKIKQYESLNWMNKMNNNLIGKLIIIYQSNNVPNKLKDYQSTEIEIQTIPYNELESRWKW